MVKLYAHTCGFTYVLCFCLETPFDSIVAQADDVTRLQMAVPFDTHAVPQHHTHASCVVTHLDHSLDTHTIGLD